ncbi:MAG: FecR family protein [Polyangia bacterium]|jgi:transmembrane sensor
MSDRRWIVLGEKVDPKWDPERARAVREAITRRAERRRTAVRATFATASTGLILIGALVFVVRGRFPQPPARSTNAGVSALPAAPPIAVAPAGVVVVTPLSQDTVLEPLPDLSGRGFRLRAGGARFSVPHNAQHPFVVVAGTVTIEDLGTAFTVRYVGADRLDVSVEEGRVRVRAAGSDTELAAGATLRVPLAFVTESEPAHAPAGLAGSSWRALAKHGAYEDAHRALSEAGPGAVRDNGADLLLAADAARLSGHPADAVPYLERVVRRHARDSRAGVAAFTLGRVLLDELARPGEAIDAFAVARAAGGPLAEDALAREVEAASRAGEVARSRELALLYRRTYPNGRRTTEVSKFGGLR